MVYIYRKSVVLSVIYVFRCRLSVFLATCTERFTLNTFSFYILGILDLWLKHVVLFFVFLHETIYGMNICKDFVGLDSASCTAAYLFIFVQRLFGLKVLEEILSCFIHF